MQDPSRLRPPEAGPSYALQAAVAGAQRCRRPAHQLQVFRQKQLVPEAPELVEQPAVQVEHLAVDPEDLFSELHGVEETPFPDIVGLGQNRNAAPAGAAAPGRGDVPRHHRPEGGIRVQEDQDVPSRPGGSPVLGPGGATFRFQDKAQTRGPAGGGFPASSHLRHDFRGGVAGVVVHHDTFEPVRRILLPAHRFDCPRDAGLLVQRRDDDGDERQRVRLLSGEGVLVAVRGCEQLARGHQFPPGGKLPEPVENPLQGRVVLQALGMEEDLDHRAAGQAAAGEQGAGRHRPVPPLHQPFVETSDAHIALPGSGDSFSGLQVADRPPLEQVAVPRGSDRRPSFPVDQPGRGAESLRFDPQGVGENAASPAGGFAGGRFRQGEELGRLRSEPGADAAGCQRSAHPALCPMGPAVRDDLAAGGSLRSQEPAQSGILRERPFARVVGHDLQHPRPDGAAIQLLEQLPHTGCERGGDVVDADDQQAPAGGIGGVRRGHQTRALRKVSARKAAHRQPQGSRWLSRCKVWASVPLVGIAQMVSPESCQKRCRIKWARQGQRKRQIVGFVDASHW